MTDQIGPTNPLFDAILCNRIRSVRVGNLFIGERERDLQSQKKSTVTNTIKEK